MGENPLSAQVGNRISLLGHFDVPVKAEAITERRELAALLCAMRGLAKEVNGQD